MIFETLNTKTIFETNVKSLIIRKFYDLDGQEISEGVDREIYETPKRIKITSSSMVMKSECIPDYHYDNWKLYIDDEYKNYGELCGYELRDDRLYLDVCTGAG